MFFIFFHGIFLLAICLSKSVLIILYVYPFFTAILHILYPSFLKFVWLSRMLHIRNVVELNAANLWVLWLFDSVVINQSVLVSFRCILKEMFPFLLKYIAFYLQLQPIAIVGFLSLLIKLIVEIDEFLFAGK